MWNPPRPQQFCARSPRTAQFRNVARSVGVDVEMQVDSPSLGHPAGQPIKTTPWPSVEHTVCAAIDLQVRWSALIDWCPESVQI